MKWQHKTLSTTQDRRVLRAGRPEKRGLRIAKAAWPTKDVRAWMARSDRKARAAAPSEVYKSSRPSSFVFRVFHFWTSHKNAVFLKFSSVHFSFFRQTRNPKSQILNNHSNPKIVSFGKLRFSGSSKKRIARFAKRCVFVVSHSARRRISVTPVSKLNAVNYSAVRINSTAPLPRSDVSSELFRPSIRPSRVYAQELEP